MTTCLPNPFHEFSVITEKSRETIQSQAKATEGKAGMAGVTGPVRRSTPGTGLRVGEAGADQPATSEFMGVTAGRDRQPIPAHVAATLDIGIRRIVEEVAAERAPAFIAAPSAAYLTAISRNS